MAANGGRCPAHTRRELYRKDGKHGWSDDRGTAHQRGYGKAWERLRKWVLIRDDYLCQPCKADGRLTQASQVDHITPKAQGGTDDESNLQAICGHCHTRKTQQESASGRAHLKP